MRQPEHGASVLAWPSLAIPDDDAGRPANLNPDIRNNLVIQDPTVVLDNNDFIFIVGSRDNCFNY